MENKITIIAFLLLTFLTGCTKDEDLNLPPDELEEVELLLKGSYQTFNDLIVTISEDEGLVTDFGKNNLGTNPEVFNLNDPYFKNLVRIGKDKYKGKVIKASYKWVGLEEVLSGIEYIDTEIELKDDGSIFVTNSNNWDISWKPASGPTNSEGTGNESPDDSGGSGGSDGSGDSGGSGGSDGSGDSGGSDGSGGSDDGESLKWGNWYFIDSDMALQVRYARESGTGQMTYKIKVQYRINKADPIYCNASTCLGYIYWGGFYSKAGGEYDAQYQFYFPNNFKGNTPGMPGVYTLPDLVSIEIKTYADGSKTIWDEELGLPMAVLTDGSKVQIYLQDACVDNELSNSNTNRCSKYTSGLVIN